MKRIGAGWQYVAYDLGNKRVLKRPRPLWEQTPAVAAGLLFTHPSALLTLQDELKRIRIDTIESAALARKLLARIDPALFGHPEFLDDVSFTQDYAQPLGSCLSRASTKEKVALFDKYAALVERMWSYGFAETVFNFTINNGVAVDGSVIQLDLGELTILKERVLRDVDTGSWRTQYSFLTVPGDLKEYAFSRMAEVMTRENVDRHWGTMGAPPQS